MQLLKKIHLLKINIEKAFSDKEEIIKEIEFYKEKCDTLQKSIKNFENQFQMQITINDSLKSLIDTQQKEKDNLKKDMQIMVAALKDIYSFVELNTVDAELIEEIVNKKLKNSTYH